MDPEDDGCDEAAHSTTRCVDAGAPAVDATPPMPLAAGSACGQTFPIATSVSDSCGQGCGFPPGHLHAMASIADFQRMFVRRWVSCGGFLISSEAGETGFEAHADGTYTILVYDAAHHLVPSATGGTYAILQEDAAFQVNFVGTSTPNSTVITSGTLTDSPRMLFLSGGTPASQLHYVPADDTDWPDDGHGICALGTYVPPPQCDAARGATLPVASQEEFSALLTKRWVLCSPQGVGADSPSQAGLDVRADGTFDVLAVDTTNRLVPASDIFSRGTFEILPNSPSTFETKFVTQGAWSRGLLTSFTDTGEMIMNDIGVYEYRYVPLDIPCAPGK